MRTVAVFCPGRFYCFSQGRCTCGPSPCATILTTKAGTTRGATRPGGPSSGWGRLRGQLRGAVLTLDHRGRQGGPDVRRRSWPESASRGSDLNEHRCQGYLCGRADFSARPPPPGRPAADRMTRSPLVKEAYVWPGGIFFVGPRRPPMHGWTALIIQCGGVPSNLCGQPRVGRGHARTRPVSRISQGRPGISHQQAYSPAAVATQRLWRAGARAPRTGAPRRRTARTSGSSR